MLSITALQLWWVVGGQGWRTVLLESPGFAADYRGYLPPSVALPSSALSPAPAALGQGLMLEEPDPEPLLGPLPFDNTWSLTEGYGYTDDHSGP